MNPDDILAATLTALQTIAPEIEPAELRRDRPLRQQVDLDSMDWLNFLLALNKRFGIGIPEADYAKLVTLADIVTYIGKKTD